MNSSSESSKPVEPDTSVMDSIDYKINFRSVDHIPDWSHLSLNDYEASKPKPASRKSIFGEAKPVDTNAKFQEIQKRLLAVKITTTEEPEDNEKKEEPTVPTPSSQPSSTVVASKPCTRNPLPSQDVRSYLPVRTQPPPLPNYHPHNQEEFVTGKFKILRPSKSEVMPEESSASQRLQPISQVPKLPMAPPLAVPQEQARRRSVSRSKPDHGRPMGNLKHSDSRFPKQNDDQGRFNKPHRAPSYHGKNDDRRRLENDGNRGPPRRANSYLGKKEDFNKDGRGGPRRHDQHRRARSFLSKKPNVPEDPDDWRHVENDKEEQEQKKPPNRNESHRGKREGDGHYRRDRRGRQKSFHQPRDNNQLTAEDRTNDCEQ